MKQEKYKIAILGATFYGISKHIKHLKDSILIECTTLPGSEYVDSFNEKGSKNADVKTEFGKAFKSTLLKHGFLNKEGEIYPSPALFLLCDFLQKTSFNILFSTVVTEIKKVTDGFEISLLNCNGFSTIYANEIIDTTSSGILHTSINQINVQKSLNIIVHKPDPFNAILEPVIRNNLIGVDIFCFPVALEDDYITARKKLHTFWTASGESLKNCRIMLTANTFAYRMPYTKKEVQPNFIWIPSCGFDNLLHAIDQGQEVL